MLFKNSDVSLAMCSSIENYVSEICDSVEFSCGKLSDVDQNAIANAVTAVIKNVSDSVNVKK